MKFQHKKYNCIYKILKYFCIEIFTFQSRSLLLFAQPSLTEGIDATQIEILQQRIAGICFEAGKTIGSSASDVFGKQIRIPLLTTSVALADSADTNVVEIKKQTHDEIGKFLAQKLGKIRISDEKPIPKCDEKNTFQNVIKTLKPS